MIRRALCFPSFIRKSLLIPPVISPYSNSSSKIGAYNGYASQTSSLEVPDSAPYRENDEYADVDWDNLGFGLMPTDYMYVNKCGAGQHFGHGQLNPYGNIHLSPSAAVLNYGQGLFEGTKAYRKENGQLLLFRPEQNAIRMKSGAQRMCMEAPSVDQFVNALKQTALANKRWVPPPGKGSLYLRPLLIGSGAVLGLAPAPEYTFLIYASPVRNYFKVIHQLYYFLVLTITSIFRIKFYMYVLILVEQEGSAPLNLYVEENFDRASRRGTGSVKTISNYAPVLMAQLRAKKNGFSDVLYLDSATKKNLEEVSSCNIFIAKGRCISTPGTNGTILAGITRKSVIELARDHGYEVQERAVAVDELMEADEVFCTGTAVGVAPVGAITYQNTRMEYKTGSGTICQELYNTLLGIQTGAIEDKKGWIIEIG
ncbi:branched-chain-amino-acid aminotransferase 2, chloroplastic isoform X1 [Arachis ipaensis]|uniref:branched-chain-amino-acid aminotransferase 2, chloroplastic isoform X1 n=1 Tax=Arachis ipaensis TaxID=130454 RepID=UPI0007AF5886|nr:branched-chain-amino-acid aminotransferase 2, chloroplastic isoform X1 [Arachis ipaensis]